MNRRAPLLGVVAAWLAAATAIVLPAPHAGAAPPVEEWSFSPSAIPPGAFTNMRFVCTGDTTTATVDLDGPGSKDFADQSVTLADDGHGTIYLGGPTSLGGIVPDVVGTYTFTVECPSGGGTTDFSVDVLTPSVPFTGTGAVFDDGAACDAGSSDVDLPFGSSVALCYAFTNPLGDIAPPDGVVWVGSQQIGSGGGYGVSRYTPGDGTDPPLPAGGQYSAMGGFAPVLLGDQDFELFVAIDDGNGNRAVSELQMVSVTMVSPVAVTVSSGLTPDTSCPSTGGEVARTVAPGTDVYFCYTMASTSGALLDDHTVVSDLFGKIVSGLSSPVQGPDGLLELPASDVLTVDAPVTNTATWETVWASFDGDIGVLGTGMATVDIGEVTPEAPPAAPVDAAPQFTG